MNPKRMWIEYRRRSITTKAPFKVVRTKVSGRILYKVMDKDGVLDRKYVRRDKANTRCERLNDEAALRIMVEP